MAKLKGPCLSLDARGQLGKTLVFMGWKGLKTVRQYVIPSNPQTADQTTQRDALTDCVSAFRNIFTVAEGRSAWNRLALTLPNTMSGFNAFIRNAVQMIVSDPDASFVDTMTEQANQLIDFGMKNLDDGAAGDEAGNFEIWAGSSPTSLLHIEDIAIAAGALVGTVDLGDAGDIVYIKVRKDGYDRSGIYKATLSA